MQKVGLNTKRRAVFILRLWIDIGIPSGWYGRIEHVDSRKTAMIHNDTDLVNYLNGYVREIQEIEPVISQLK